MTERLRALIDADKAANRADLVRAAKRSRQWRISWIVCVLLLAFYAALIVLTPQN